MTGPAVCKFCETPDYCISNGCRLALYIAPLGSEPDRAGDYRARGRRGLVDNPARVAP